MRFPLLKCATIMLVALALGSCASLRPTQAPPTSTPDPCDRANIEAGLRGVNDFMREFDDASQLASNVPRDSVSQHITTLQAIRRAAEDQAVPECLNRLKQLEVLHMNLVIGTLMTFLGGSSQQGVAEGVAAAQYAHNQYLLEASALLGLTPIVVTVAPTIAGGAASGTADATVAAPANATSSPAPAPPTPAVLAINPGPIVISMRGEPNETAAVVGTLQVGESAAALGTNPEATWIKVMVPGSTDRTAWVLATEVQLTNANP